MERFEEYTARGLKKNGSWSIGFFLYQDGKTFIYGRGVNDDFKAEVLPETVGRFTCQYDRFLNKMFEGDIVKKTKTDAICTVKWSGGKWILKNGMNGDEEELFWYKAEDLEIIGNVYEQSGKAISLKNDIDSFLKSYIAEPARDSEDGEDVYMDMYRLLVRTRAILENTEGV